MKTLSERMRILLENKELGDCFEVHGRFILNRVAGKETENYTLVHGMVHGKGKLDGYRFAHCWLEYKGNVIDISNGLDIKIPKSVYYHLGKITSNDVFKYNPKEAMKKIVEMGHWGCWDFEGNIEKINENLPEAESEIGIQNVKLTTKEKAKFRI